MTSPTQRLIGLQSVESSGDASVVALPWSEWNTPLFRECSLKGLHVAEDSGKLFIQDDGEVVGAAGPSALSILALETDFPYSSFVHKLPAGLQAQIFNDRIQAARDREVLLVTEGEDVSHFIRRSVGVLPYRETCELTWATLTAALPEGCSVDRASLGADGLTLRLLAPIEQPVTRAIGDTLALGIQVHQNYGTTTDVSLYLRRLVCLNGMTTENQAFQWTRRGETTPAFQRQWLQDSILNALEGYEEVVERARRMSETRLEGEPREALLARARAAGVPARHFESLWSAWQAEEDPTEWGVANAMTRLATHTALPGNLGRRLQEAAGAWTQAFDLVTCRLPRPVAVAAGGQIIEAE